jgi:hypothetical protein
MRISKIIRRFFFEGERTDEARACERDARLLRRIDVSRSDREDAEKCPSFGRFFASGATIEISTARVRATARRRTEPSIRPRPRVSTRDDDARRGVESLIFALCCSNRNGVRTIRVGTSDPAIPSRLGGQHAEESDDHEGEDEAGGQEDHRQEDDDRQEAGGQEAGRKEEVRRRLLRGAVPRRRRGLRRGSVAEWSSWIAGAAGETRR